MARARRSVRVEGIGPRLPHRAVCRFLDAQSIDVTGSNMSDAGGYRAPFDLPGQRFARLGTERLGVADEGSLVLGQIEEFFVVENCASRVDWASQTATAHFVHTGEGSSLARQLCFDLAYDH